MSTITKTIILKGNDKAILPRNANIISVAVDGFSSVTSSCDNLPTPVQMVCAGFHMAESNPSGGPTPAYQDVFLNGIVISGVRYDFTEFNINENNVANEVAGQFATAISTLSINNLFVDLKSAMSVDASRYSVHLLEFKIAADLIENSYIIGYGTVTGTPTNGSPILMFPMKRISDMPEFAQSLSNCS